MADVNTILQIGASGIKRLTTAFEIQSIQPIRGTGKNPYEGKTGEAPALDEPLRRSILGTPIFCDLTLGDPNNAHANAWTDNDGFLHSFKPVIFETLLMTIEQAKEIEVTAIQGRKGKVKEYIALDDYQVTINGILPGSNGVYPRGDVSQLQQLLEAPIALVTTSWWLQLFNIHYLVIKDFSFPQLPGEQSQQVFSIHAMSDDLLEIQFIPGA